jgi:hypothetical protein
MRTYLQAALVTGAELKQALSRLVEHRGGNPERLAERGAVVSLAKPTLSQYESGARPVPPMLERLVRAELRILDLESR